MKKLICFIFVGMMTSLIGCADINKFVENEMLRKSGVPEDGNYQAYKQYEKDGKLGKDGYYTDLTETDNEEHPPVHVTFGENNNLEIHYYSDAEHSQNLDTGTCYLTPGDSVYAQVTVKDSTFSNMYEFDRFRIQEIGEDGKQNEVFFSQNEGNLDNYVLTIPENYSGTELTVEPLGQYRNRILSFNDYYLDEDEDEKDPNGTWMINEKEYDTGTAEINPVSSYIISYKYDKDEYFFVSSEPDCYYSNNDDGIVIFEQRDANDETLDYKVELHKYISTVLVSDKDREVNVNSTGYKSLKANDELPINKVKYGEKITIETDKTWEGLEKNKNLILTNMEPLSYGYYKYTLIVPEKNGRFLFDPSEYTYEHGKIGFKCFGRTVTAPQMLAPGSRIYYEQKSADNGYWLAGNNHFVTVTDEAETKKRLNEIHFTPMIPVSLSLPQPNYGGTVEYKLNNALVYGDYCNAYSGSEITMKLVPWEGWIPFDTGIKSYKVKGDKNQTVSFGGTAIDSLFTEDEEHKPYLNVTLEKSVGEKMAVTLKASGYSMEATNYGGGWEVKDILPFTQKTETYSILDNSQLIVDSRKIGTEIPIEVSMTNKAIQTGKAVRMRIIKTDSKNSPTEEVRYIDDLSNPIDPIEIYPAKENGKSKVWYNSINITIGIVDVQRFYQTAASAHTSLTVCKEDTNEILKIGDLIEGDQGVIVTIKPKEGYYVTGTSVGNGLYQKTMKYNDYLKNVDRIVGTHQAEAYYVINLDATDSYAKYTYKLDGKPVSGRINTKEGQKLELTYEIIDPKYVLSGSSGGLFGVGISNKKVTSSIVITPSMQGKTITKADFNIETMEGE